MENREAGASCERHETLVSLERGHPNPLWRFGTSSFSLSDRTTLLPPAEALHRWHAEMYAR
jgi:hypothetical protein